MMGAVAFRRTGVNAAPRRPSSTSAVKAVVAGAAAALLWRRLFGGKVQVISKPAPALPDDVVVQRV